MAWLSLGCVHIRVSVHLVLTFVQAVLHQLATHTRPLCFFATHYGSLTDDYSYHPNIRNMHMSTIVDEEKRDVGTFQFASGLDVFEADPQA